MPTEITEKNFDGDPEVKTSLKIGVGFRQRVQLEAKRDRRANWTDQLIVLAQEALDAREAKRG